MQPPIRALLAQLAATNTSQRDEAGLTLALILENSNILHQSGVTAAHLLPEEYRHIILSETEQTDVAQAIYQLIRAGHAQTGQLFWVMGKMLPKVAIEPVLTLLENNRHQLDEDMIYQALIALENCLDLENDSNVTSALKTHSPLEFLQNLRHAHDERVVKIAQRLFNSIVKSTTPE